MGKAILYSNELLVKEAREIYFSRSGFDSKTYTESWIKLPIWNRHFYLPNFSARKKAVPLHDIDHILTEYNTDWKGEWQIAAYEIGTGCGKYWAGWMINLQGILAGSIFYPRDSVRAFARGRRSQGVFSYESYQPLLTEKVGDLRKRLMVPDDNVIVSVGDVILFYLAVFFSFGIFFGPLIALAKVLFT
jgi:hypothetical protein